VHGGEQWGDADGGWCEGQRCDGDFDVELRGADGSADGDGWSVDRDVADQHVVFFCVDADGGPRFIEFRVVV